MGRATEYYDYLNCPVDDLKDHQEQYFAFTPDAEDKKTRRRNLKRLRDEKKIVDLKSPIFEIKENNNGI